MAGYPLSMQNLITQLMQLPGVGPKTAERFAFYIIRADSNYAKGLSESVVNAKKTIRFCARCNNLSDEELCNICKDPLREKHTLCVVEQPINIIALEKSGVFKGLYYCLLGRLSPLEGIGPQELGLERLVTRIRDEHIKEIILATDSDTEGEATALYLARILKNLKVHVTRIASGVPVGFGLENTDYVTLAKALQGRHEI